MATSKLLNKQFIPDLASTENIHFLLTILWEEWPSDKNKLWNLCNTAWKVLELWIAISRCGGVKSENMHISLGTLMATLTRGWHQTRKLRLGKLHGSFWSGLETSTQITIHRGVVSTAKHSSLNIDCHLITGCLKINKTSNSQTNLLWFRQLWLMLCAHQDQQNLKT